MPNPIMNVDIQEDFTLPAEEDLTIYICGGDDMGKTTAGREVTRALASQGFKVKFVDTNPGDPTEHFQKMRALRDKSATVHVRTASFPAARVKEIMDRESEQKDKPVMLVRIHWGENLLSEKIKGDTRYLVKCADNAWYTGRFVVRTNGGSPYWSLVEMDGREFLDNSKYRDLTRESNRNGIIEVYEIVK